MLNWVDYIIILVLVFYAVEGYALGVLPAFFDLVQFSSSFFLGLTFYAPVSSLLRHYYPIPQGISYAISFFTIAFVSEFLLFIFFRIILKKVMHSDFFQRLMHNELNKILGILPGIVSGLVLMMFIITIVASLPTSPFLKTALKQAKIGSILLARSQLIEKQVDTVFGKAANDTINFLTVEPDSNSSVSLGFTYNKGTIDTDAQNQMLLLVNAEREKVGLSDVKLDSTLQTVAQAHAFDMLQRGYFSHYTPEGLSPFDRMNAAGIHYQAAGENLAFSPNVDLAMQGLMNSPGHRANILSKDFGKVGIGVVDAGIYGEMFVQEFTN